MDVALDIASLIAGGLLLYLGAEWLVKGSAGLARAFGVKPIVIGLTVIAYGTSAPELSVSTAAILDDSSAIVLGNVIGSCIANLGLILGLTALIAPPAIDGRLIRREVPVLLVAIAAVPLTLLGGSIGRIEGAILTTIAVLFTMYTLFVSSGDPARALESVLEEPEQSEQPGQPAPPSKSRLLAITALGLALLVGGGELFVDGAKSVALALGMSERLIGLTVVAAGTSLPELAACLVAALRGFSSLAVGNVIGSSIFNVFLILGVTGTIRPIEGSVTALRVDVAFLLGTTVLAVVFMRGERRMGRIEGALLLAAYVAFVAVAAVY